MTIDDVDLVEINEAFAAQVHPVGHGTSGSTWTSSTSHGGAIALGHPFGMTGARIMTTLLNGLRGRDGDHRPRDHVRRRRPGHGDDRRAPRRTAGEPPSPGFPPA